jgi:hypothetical protein
MMGWRLSERRRIDGRINPGWAITERNDKAKGRFGFIGPWFPIQVNQKDKAVRPVIDQFEAVMMRENRPKGFFRLIRLHAGCRE